MEEAKKPIIPPKKEKEEAPAIPIKLPKSHARRDKLREIEKEMQEIWIKEKAFEQDAPEDYSSMSWEEKNSSKYLMTFPYPYMNGRLHLGHAFSLSKVEFRSRYQRMLGKRTLWPFAFHCTGMPIQASADLLKKELEIGEKGRQWRILEKMMIKEEEIPKFSVPEYWMEYFPPQGKEDLVEMGVSVDWRRSFITTKRNPYYDSFVQWQFRHLKEQGRILYGKRYTVFSPEDNQPCSDHDRRYGEGARPQEYVLVKLKVLPPYPEVIADLGDKNIYMVAATLRAETMYGQTNCFLLPTGEYGLYESKTPGDIYICSPYSARGMAYQDMLIKDRKYDSIRMVYGKQLIGCRVKAPLSPYEYIYTLPMFTIKMNKGTGVVTSVPSDAPDDYAAIIDCMKPKLMEEFKLTDDMITPYKPVPILQIPGFGDMAAVYMCEKLKIKSQNDTEKLKEAKDACYLKGFTDGVMTVGICRGEKVSVAKEKIKALLVGTGEGVIYSEPEERVVSRSGDECIVSLCNQWIIPYGEPEWQKFCKSYVTQGNLECYNEVTYNNMVETLDWLKEWACARTKGLGTNIPWDPGFTIEALSDSTIYHAYYTISHLLQKDIFGDEPGVLGIKPEQMNDQVFDYVFLGKEIGVGDTTSIPLDKLNILRNEFMYWFPMDLSSSGKDLIKNHLTMSLYIYAAIFGMDKKMMPKSYFCNGWSMVNGQKMSKSKGNFWMLKEAIDYYGADAARIALCDSGDTPDDANYEDATANSAVNRLFVLNTWINELITTNYFVPTDKVKDSLFEEIFENEINYCIVESKKGYEMMKYKDALKYGFFELHRAKDEYIAAKGLNNTNPKLMLKYIEIQFHLIYPICPHFADYTWRNYIYPLMGKLGIEEGKPKSMTEARYPEPSKAPNMLLRRIKKYLENVKHEMRITSEKLAFGKKSKGKKNKGGEDVPAKKFKTCIIYIYIYII